MSKFRGRIFSGTIELGVAPASMVPRQRRRRILKLDFMRKLVDDRQQT